MRFLHRELLTAVLVTGLGGCLFASMRNEPASTAPLTSARIHASTAAPSLPILVLRTAHDELDLPPGERSNVGMIVSGAELDVRTLDRARAALLEGLARGVDAGWFDETLIATLIDQMSWAAGEVAPRLRTALDHLYELLTPEQRAEVVARTKAKLPNWSSTWATEPEHRWLDGWPRGELPDFTGDLQRTSRSWAETSVESVRARLPHLDAAQRRALAASLRTGAAE